MLGLLATVVGCDSAGADHSTNSPTDPGAAETNASSADSGSPVPTGSDVGLPETGAAARDRDAGLPEIPLGAPIHAPDGVWTQVPFPDAYCRDGTKPQINVHLNSKSKKIAIFLEGGGACFNDFTCKFLTINDPAYTAGQGVFNFNNPANPIGDWNIFEVPYCTGDVYAGSNPRGNPGPATGVQNYTGYTNLQLFLSRILATVPDATDELLTGSSAGGFGTGLTAGLVARNAPASVERVTMLDDSGQPMSSQYLQPCLQDKWRTVWGFDNTFLKECGAACPTKDDYAFDWIQYLLNTYAKGPMAPKFMGGLISSTSDAEITTFYGFGANNCTVTLPTAVGAAQFEAGLLGFRALVQGLTNSFGTYFVANNYHTFLLVDKATQSIGVTGGGLYDTQVNGVKLTDWIADLLAHKQAAHVGP
jgi:hypothetical protein